MDEISVHHYSAALFKYLNEVQIAIIVELLMDNAQKVLGNEKTEEIIERKVNEQLAKNKAREAYLVLQEMEEIDNYEAKKTTGFSASFGHLNKLRGVSPNSNT